ncbi:MAG: sce7726 family protein, partial [Clostridia bacterium]|nr:sce7726 family protein [Clostridia bacterium]
MNDREIRNILIAYLRAQGREMRIYPEKSIGSSICDLMTVTDRLTGYEIKSDRDNYRRLAEQVRTYDRFFDRNYIVVGHSHLASVPDKVPDHWGIILIEKDSVSVHREARDNRSVSRRTQLSVLWKLELKNILLKNGMPLYAQKEKGYISDRIADLVGDDVLRKQIASELLHRDYSVFEGSSDRSLHIKGSAPGLPAEELADMLSENDLEEFTLDRWIEIYKQAREIRERKETLFAQKPAEPRIPHEIPYTDIEVSLGAPWIGVRIINDFIGHITYGREVSSSLCRYEPVTGNWFIEDKRSYFGAAAAKNLTVTFGTERYNALYIIEASLNLREIRLCGQDGRFDERETVAALEKQKKIEQEFRDWIWLDEDRRWEIEDSYNRMFGEYGEQDCDGSRLRFEGMSAEYDLYP